MRKVAKTVNERVWQHIEDMSESPAFLVKNQGGVQQVVSALPAAGRPVVLNTREKTREVSWKIYGHMVAELSLFLQQSNIKPGDRVAILGWDSYQWMVLNRAIKCLGGIVVPLYPNTTPEQDAHIINDSTPKLLFAEDAGLAKKILPELCTAAPDLRVVLYADAFKNVPDVSGKNILSDIHVAGKRFLDKAPSDGPEEFSTAAKAEFERLKTLYTTGADPGFASSSPSTLIYTSGSTSLPKGAIHTHESIAASCQLLLDLGFDFNPSDILLHYLPFAHIYGLANGVEMCEWVGVISAFSMPTELKETLPLYEPTALLGVPRVWNRMRVEVEKQTTAAGFQGKMLRWAFKQKKGLGHLFANILVFRKIRKKLGMNKVRLIMSGSAAIPMDTVEFFNQIGISLREGYGLTETCGGITASTLVNFKYNSLGKPAPGVEWKIVPREGGVDADEPKKGKLYVKGKFLFCGYWNNEKKTKEAFVDGWFDTGDIVSQDEDGYLWYRGRAGRQKKLDTGEFYGEELIQTAMENFDLVQAAVPTGEGYPSVGALFFLDAATAKKIAGPAPAGVALHEYLAKSDKVREALKQVVTEANAALLAGGQAKKWEQVRSWEIIPLEATVDNGLLTPSLKIKNEEVLKRYADMVKAMYAKNRG
ncbi:MAG TPA: AMP-binding protein [Planktothrix sp.]|jgi:long-chain acyl-CoA synthetase